MLAKTEETSREINGYNNNLANIQLVKVIYPLLRVRIEIKKAIR